MIIRKQVKHKNIYSASGELLGVRIKVCFENTETNEIKAVTKDFIHESCVTNPEEFNEKLKDQVVFHELENKAKEGL